MTTPMTILRDKLIEEYQNIKESIPNQHALGYMEALKNIANDIDDNMLMEERKAFIEFGYNQIKHIGTERCEIVYNRVPEEIFNETFTNEP